MIGAILASLIIFGTFAVIQSRKAPPHSELIPSPFKPFDGAWQGKLVVKDEKGEIIEDSEMAFENRHINARRFFRQEAHVVRTDVKSGETTEFDMVHKADFERQHFSRRLLLDRQRRAEDYDGELHGDGSFTWTRDTTSLKEIRKEWIEDGVYRVSGTMERRLPEPKKLTLEGEYHRVEPASGGDEKEE